MVGLITNDRVKHLMIKEQWQDLDVRFIFVQADNKILKGSKLRMQIGVIGMVFFGHKGLYLGVDG